MNKISCIKLRYIALFAICLFISSTSYAGKRETKNVNVGDEFTVFSTYHSYTNAVLWQWDTGVLELVGTLYGTSTSATFKVKKASPTSGVVIQATTYYYRSSSSSSGLNTDLDTWTIHATDNSTVSLNATSITLSPGQYKTLVATPSNSSYSGGYNWTSTNYNVATLSGYGNTVSVNAKNSGSTTVRVTLDNGKYAECHVTVQSGGGGSSDITINATNFPDDVFRWYLLQQSYGWDGVITAAEISGITSIDVGFLNISSLKGIEYFTKLKTLSCYLCKLTSLDVSNNTELEDLSCQDNQLTSLNISNNTALTTLVCSGNKLTSLDVSNTALTHLYCSRNKLTSLDVSKNTALTYLSCEDNQLTSLNVSNTAQTHLSCYNNRIKGESMDVLISSLPRNTTDRECGLFIFYSNSSTEGNVCTKTQVAAIKAKGWTPYYYDGGWKKYEGSDDDASGINAVHAGKESKNVIYTLGGVRLNTTNVSDLPKGIYIVNGKKVTVK